MGSPAGEDIGGGAVAIEFGLIPIPRYVRHALPPAAIRMFSFARDVLLVLFLGSGTTAIAACKSGRNSVGIEVDQWYLNQARSRFEKQCVLLPTLDIRVGV